ncbi:protein of unknown function [Brevefilum fermentans]|uniref:Uncharacterized protein n=1 Tax=Candidatus Brevifilum fermentans TaxID=1986204 RepID=A0A1Y6K2V3_9CHLR|nr:protein of unknown function [Brevefilum fermentans]
MLIIFTQEVITHNILEAGDHKTGLDFMGI